MSISTRVAGVLLLLASSVQAERYYVTEDSFGNVDANQSEQKSTPPETSPPATWPSATTAPSQTKGAALVVDKPEPAQRPKATASLGSAVERVLEPVSGAKPAQADLNQQQSAGVDNQLENFARDLLKQSTAEQGSKAIPTGAVQGDELQGDEIDFPALPSVSREVQTSKVEREAKADDNPFTRAFRQSEGQNPYDATQVSEQDYVDGYDLLEGRILQPARQPFFVTRDLDGNEQITFYSPTLAKEARDKAQTELRLSEATIYSAGAGNTIQARLPADADPQALAILMSASQSQDDYFTGFAKRCCELLPKAGVKVLEFGRAEHLRVTEDLLPYRFAEGDSRYLIFKLPASRDDYILELRAFVRKYKSEGVSHGVFFPQVITLSKALKPLRIIVNPVLSYSPETWSSYAFLQGVFKVDRSKGQEEEYVLVNTTREQLKLSSQYYSGDELVAIEHMKYGSLGVKVLLPTP